jgi:hypothetical protein
MHLYTHFADGTKRTISQFKYVSAHEFGHMLGIGDAYNGTNAMSNPLYANDLMMVQMGVTSETDIYMVLEAWRINQYQLWS